MTSNNVYILLAIIRSIIESSKEKINDSLLSKNTSENFEINDDINYLNSVLEKLSNDMYILEMMKNSKDNKHNLESNTLASIYNRIHDPIKNHKDNLSLAQFAFDLSILSSKMSLFFVLQDNIIKIYQWHSYLLTTSVLLILTFICYNPIVLVILPILLITFYTIIPEYCTLKNNTNSSLHNKIENKSLKIKLSKSISLEDNVNNSMEFIINLTDLQNMLTFFVKTIDKINSFLFENKSLRNNRSYSISVVSIIVQLCLLSFVITRFVTGSSFFFTIILWFIFLKANPHVSKFFSYFTSIIDIKSKDDNKGNNNILNYVTDYIKENYPITETYDEVFEFQQKNNNSNCQWETIIFTKEPSVIINNHNNIIKKQNFNKKILKLKGCRYIENIQAKKGWLFKKNEKWEVDKNVSASTWILSKKCFPLELFKFDNKDQLIFNDEKRQEFLYFKNCDLRIRRFKKKIIKKKKKNK
ncbi:hypothetical protein HANVADRAFT_2958 [Hanseniaspora valbyensis NRRL Y-1626]|uniref:TECPR1-like DysF domain-containing protein n=1 Tax=Hanseniaspora valbyensis NRRL Y-1626 TaxID=766949 RepID=A0A1B7TBV1_9ASCO|nr:hypothetical protein HANVADRAFT_2958 [Hanseniaspora valbyensis NRRL Y-1626]